MEGFVCLTIFIIINKFFVRFNMTDKKQNILLLFDRPQEPVFMVKGDKKAQFDVPQEYLVNYKSNPTSLVLLN